MAVKPAPSDPGPRSPDSGNGARHGTGSDALTDPEPDTGSDPEPDTGRNTGSDTEPGTGRGAEPPAVPGEQEPSPLERRITTFAQVVGLGAVPPSIAVGLLFYFGYVASRRRFVQFGIDLDMLDLSTQAVLLYGSEALWLPLVALFLATLLGIWGHVELGRLIRRSRTDPGTKGTALTWSGAVLLVAGLLVLGRGVAGLVVVELAYDEAPGTTPLALAVGVLVTAYGRWLITWRRTNRPRVAERAAAVAVLSVAVAALFWASGSYAATYGRSRAADTVNDLPYRAEIILDTTERLYLDQGFPGVTETILPARKGDKFAYRYRGLRLLTESAGRLYLIPAAWPRGAGWPRVWRGGGTLVVPNNDTVRLRLLPFAGP
ncbi:hypothetical protein ACFSKW_42685 [Nonomuraea mangrovi]|uniref:DUF5671 domain-containing protein n=1 Tax=Nonomuraea mangrovi TaxID=2316207 RepID=A0ABW4TAQ4_9ACTN